MADRDEIDYELLATELAELDVQKAAAHAIRILVKDRESLQSQLAAANERADAAVKALAYVIRDLEIRAGTSGVVELGHSAYLQAKRVLDQNVRLAGADAPVPSQPAVVQDAVVRALIEAVQMAVEMIETEKHERRHVRWALKDALLAAKTADTEGRKDE